MGGYLVGKEELYIYLSENLGIKIGVDKRRFDIYKELCIDQYFTTDLSTTNIRVIDRLYYIYSLFIINSKLKNDFITELNKTQPTYGIDISGLSNRSNPLIVPFPYSLHSSYDGIFIYNNIILFKLEINAFLNEVPHQNVILLNQLLNNAMHK